MFLCWLWAFKLQTEEKDLFGWQNCHLHTTTDDSRASHIRTTWNKLVVQIYLNAISCSVLPNRVPFGISFFLFCPFRFSSSNTSIFSESIFVKFVNLLVECEIVGFGIRNSTRGIRNPSNDWNLHSNCHCYGVQIALVKFSAVPAKNLTQVMALRFLTGSVNRSPKRTNIQPVENLSSICPVPCERRLHLNLVPRNFLFQKFTFLSILLQNIIDIPHCC